MLFHIQRPPARNKTGKKPYRPMVLIPVIAILLAMGVSPHSAGAEEGLMVQRDGPRPQTTPGVPHVQIDVEPIAPALFEDLLQRVSAIPDVDVRATVISLPGAMGFWLRDGVALAHPEAIVGGREFAHVHPDGSLHAALHPKRAEDAIEAGWAVAHPWARQPRGWEGFVMIYTPRSADEVGVVLHLIAGSYNYVTGRNFRIGKDG